MYSRSKIVIFKIEKLYFKNVEKRIALSSYRMHGMRSVPYLIEDHSLDVKKACNLFIWAHQNICSYSAVIEIEKDGVVFVTQGKKTRWFYSYQSQRDILLNFMHYSQNQEGIQDTIHITDTFDLVLINLTLVSQTVDEMLEMLHIESLDQASGF